MPETKQPEQIPEQVSHHKIRSMQLCALFESIGQSMTNSNIHAFTLYSKYKNIEELSFALKQTTRLINIGVLVPDNNRDKLRVPITLKAWFIDQAGNCIDINSSVVELNKNLIAFYDCFKNIEEKNDSVSRENLKMISKLIEEIDQIYLSLEFLVR